MVSIFIVDDILNNTEPATANAEMTRRTSLTPKHTVSTKKEAATVEIE